MTEEEVDRIGPLTGISIAGDFSVDVQMFGIELYVRPVMLGINFQGQRVEVQGKSVAPGTRIDFEIPPALRNFDDLEPLYVIDRFIVDADTNSTNVTPTLVFEQSSQALTAVNTSARRRTEAQLDRIGPLQEVQLAADFTTDIQLFGIELYIRPLTLGINFHGGRRIEVTGRATDSSTEVIWDVKAFQQEMSNITELMIVDRLTIEIDTNSTTVTPKITTNTGTHTLSTINNSAKGMVEISIDQIGSIDDIQLEADFTTNIQIWRVELYVRPAVLGITIGQQRAEIGGRSAVPNTTLTFDIDPENKLLDMLSFIPLVERLTIDVDTKNTSGNNITAKILVADADTITLSPAFGTAARETVTFDVNRVGKVRGVELDAPWNSGAISLFGLEMIVRPLELTVRVLAFGQETTLSGNVITSTPVGIV